MQIERSPHASPSVASTRVNQAGARHRIVIEDSDDSEEEEHGSGGMHMPGSGGASGGRQDAITRELARLSAWAWDSRKEVHPRNESVYGLADGKRSRRQRMTSSQMVQVLGGSEEQELSFAMDARQNRPRRKRKENHGQDTSPAEGAYEYESSSDDDVPLAAQVHRFRTPASQRRQQDVGGCEPTSSVPRDNQTPQEPNNFSPGAAQVTETPIPGVRSTNASPIVPATEALPSEADIFEQEELMLAPPCASPAAKEIQNKPSENIPEAVVVNPLEPASANLIVVQNNEVNASVPALMAAASQQLSKSPAAHLAAQAARALLGSLYSAEKDKDKFSLDVDSTEVKRLGEGSRVVEEVEKQCPLPPLQLEAMPALDSDVPMLMGIVPNSQDDDI